MRQAAEQVGVSRQTMFRHIKEGRVSATLSHSGEKQIEVTELLRAFGSLQAATVTPTTPSNRSRQSHSDSATPATVAYQIELERLRAQLEIKTAELDLAKERIAELKTREHGSQEEKNRLLTLIEQQSRLLAAPVKPQSTAVTRAVPAKPTTKLVLRNPKASAPKAKAAAPKAKAAAPKTKAAAPKTKAAAPKAKAAAPKTKAAAPKAKAAAPKTKAAAPKAKAASGKQKRG